MTCLDNRDAIVEKSWRKDDDHHSRLSLFSDLVKTPSVKSGIPTYLVTTNGVLVHICRHSLYFVALVKTDVPPLSVTEFLSTLADVLLDYFGELNEFAIKDNFITLYELLDEMLDNGLPMTTDLDILRGLIKPPNMLHKIIDTFAGDYAGTSDRPMRMSAVPWRRPGVKYAVNEIFVDILEEIDCITSPGSATIVNGFVRGTVMVNSLLSGMPDMTMRLRGMHMISDVSLHPCVRYKRYDADGTISFIPPDGNFKLLNYIVRDHAYFSLPVEVQAIVKFNDNHTGSVSISVHPRVRAPIQETRYSPQTQTPLQRGGTLLTKMFDKAGVAVSSNPNTVLDDVIVKIPFSMEVTSISLNPSFGIVHFDHATKVCEWNIGGVPKDITPRLVGTVDLEPKLPIPLSPPSVLSQFTVRGVALTGLSVQKLEMGPSEQYRYYKGMKCLSKARRYETRV